MKDSLMKKTSLAISLAGLMYVTAFGAAQAHTGVDIPNGFALGFVHPFSGLDHLTAMVAVGMLAARVGGRALVIVPAAFVGMMVVGGVLGFAGIPVHFVEQGIGLSVIVLGLLVMLGIDMPTILAMSVVGLFAVFHGHAHGTELPIGSAPAAFAAGFVLATALLHAAGIGLGIMMKRFAVSFQASASRIIGAGMSLIGISLFAN